VDLVGRVLYVQSVTIQSLDSVTDSQLQAEIAASLARSGITMRAVDTRVSMTAKIQATAAVAAHLDTDLTTERIRRNDGDCDAWTFRWLAHRAGDHHVAAESLGVRIIFAVDTTCGRVWEL
jgi:hypothetical protein